MGSYSVLKRSAQYAVLTFAFIAGAGADHFSQKETIDSKVQFYQRKPGEPCVLPVEHKEPVKVPDGACYVVLAALGAAAFGYAIRRRDDKHFENKLPSNPKNFFGEEEF